MTIPTILILKKNTPLYMICLEKFFRKRVNMNCDLQKICFITNRLTFHQIDFSRSPLSTSNVKAYKQLKKVIADGNYDIVIFVII